MPALSFDDGGGIGEELLRLGNTLAGGPQKRLQAEHVREQIAASQENRARLQAEFDAKRDAANLQPNMDALMDAKRAAGPNWTPDQEEQLRIAQRKFGQGTTMAGALGGEAAAKGAWYGQGQTRMLVEQPQPGSNAYTQVYTATAGRPPDPSKEVKSPEIMVFGDDTGRQVSIATHDLRTNAYTGKPIAEELPAGFRMLGKASPVAVQTPGFGDEKKNANDLQIANQQILRGQTPNEPLASLAQKYYALNPTVHQAAKDPFGGNIVVGFNKEEDNPGLQAIQQHLRAEYYGKGQTAKPTATPTVPPAAPGGTGAATAQPGQNVLPGSEGSLLTPPSSGLGGGGQTAVRTQNVPAGQAPTAPLPGPGGATAQPGAPVAGGPANVGQTPQKTMVWRPSPAGPLAPRQAAGGMTVTPITRGFDQQEATNFAKDPTTQQWRVTERGYNEMQRAAKYDNAYGDLHMIYALAKIMDPGSAVREGELDLAKGAQSPAQWLLGWWSYAKGGGRLTADSRAKLMQQAYGAATTNYESAVNLAQQSNDMLLKRGLDPSQHLPELVQPAQFDPKEVNRFGDKVYQIDTGDRGQDAELIKLAGQIQGGQAGQTSTSVAGAPPAAPPTSGTTRRGAAAVQAAPPAAAPATAPPAPPPTTAAVAPTATRRPDDDALFSAADAIVGRRR